MMFGVVPWGIIENTITLPLRQKGFFQVGYVYERQIML